MKKYVKSAIDRDWDVEARDFLTDEMGVSEEAVSLVENINGRNLNTYEDILYVITGYRDFDSYYAELLDEFDE